MFDVLRLIHIIATALGVLGWAFVPEAPAQRSFQDVGDVVLEAMPEIPPRSVPEKRNGKYRTPFIVPISSPDFGDVPGPIELATSPKTLARIADSLCRANHFVAPFAELHGKGAADTAKSPDDVFAWMEVGNRDASPATTFAWSSRAATIIPVAAAGPNLSGLSERVTLHNLGLAAIEDQLRARDNWTLKDLESIQKQLQALHESRQLWMLYWELLNPKEQWRVGTPSSYATSIELMKQRTFEAQVALDINPFSVTNVSEQEAITRLEAIVEKIELLSERSTTLND